jgi:SynChlorMet cassette protein ScmD
MHREGYSMEQKPIINPLIVLREEFDDWAILFDPDTGEGFGLNPVSVFVWKQLDGRHTVGDIIAGLRDACDVLPAKAEEHVQAFITALMEKGLVGSALN